MHLGSWVLLASTSRRVARHNMGFRPPCTFPYQSLNWLCFRQKPPEHQGCSLLLDWSYSNFEFKLILIFFFFFLLYLSFLTLGIIFKAPEMIELHVSHHLFSPSLYSTQEDPQHPCDRWEQVTLKQSNESMLNIQQIAHTKLYSLWSSIGTWNYPLTCEIKHIHCLKTLSRLLLFPFYTSSYHSISVSFAISLSWDSSTVLPGSRVILFIYCLVAIL